jgi:hypothetical protein
VGFSNTTAAWAEFDINVLAEDLPNIPTNGGRTSEAITFQSRRTSGATNCTIYGIAVGEN